MNFKCLRNQSLKILKNYSTKILIFMKLSYLVHTGKLDCILFWERNLSPANFFIKIIEK